MDDQEHLQNDLDDHAHAMARRDEATLTAETLALRRRPTAWTHDVEVAFLAALAATGALVHSARVAGVDVCTVDNHRRADPEFARRVELAQQRHDELIDEEIDRRGRRGIPKSVWYKGERVAVETEFSDALLLARAKARMPRYRDKAVEVDVARGGVLVVVPGGQDADEWRRKFNGDES